MSHNEQILNHMKRGGRITPLDALQQYNCFRLAARIYDLRRSGNEIHTELIKRGEKQWAEYTLLKAAS